MLDQSSELVPFINIYHVDDRLANWRHCQSKRSSLPTTIGAIGGCLTIGAVGAGLSIMNPPPVNPQDAPGSGSMVAKAAAEREQNATPHLSGADPGQGYSVTLSIC